VSLGPSTAIVDRLVEAITVSGGRRAGDPETRVHLDHLMPSPSGPAIAGPARWRLSTSQARFYPAPVGREALRAWHAADAPKGRRLLATDLANDHRVAAMLSWHSSRAVAAVDRTSSPPRPSGTVPRPPNFRGLPARSVAVGAAARGRQLTGVVLPGASSASNLSDPSTLVRAVRS
jgi:hypothetical protein